MLPPPAPEDEPTTSTHFGGGRKGMFVLLRYVFIVAAGYLVIANAPPEGIPKSTALMIAAALGSNLLLSIAPRRTLFAWYVEAPVLVADALWVSWALHTTGAVGGEFFLLYFFVLFLAATGESISVVMLGSVGVSAVNVFYLLQRGEPSAAIVLRLCFFVSVALFYGNMVLQIRRERQRADKGLAWARELEAEVAARTAELQELYDHARSASRTKSEFVANVSHELRTPLHIILGYADMLMDEDTTEPATLALRIRKVALDLLILVEGVLDLGKVEAGRDPVELRRVPLAKLLSEVQQRERIARQPGVELSWQIPSDLPTIETDPHKLSVVLDNLVNNAIKFTRAGQIVVAARHCDSVEAVEITVSDTGPGIDPASRHAIFEPFHQARGGDDQPSEGVGLGLAIVNRYVGMLSGQISVSSVVGEGTTFTIRLPHPSVEEIEPGQAAA